MSFGRIAFIFCIILFYGDDELVGLPHAVVPQTERTSGGIQGFEWPCPVLLPGQACVPLRSHNKQKCLGTKAGAFCSVCHSRHTHTQHTHRHTHHFEAVCHEPNMKRTVLGRAAFHQIAAASHSCRGGTYPLLIRGSFCSSFPPTPVRSILFLVVPCMVVYFLSAVLLLDSFSYCCYFVDGAYYCFFPSTMHARVIAPRRQSVVALV